MSKKANHVVPNTRGGWSVKKSGSARSTRSFSTQREAIQVAKQVSKNEESSMYIHREDGSIRERYSYVASDCASPKKDR